MKNSKLNKTKINNKMCFSKNQSGQYEVKYMNNKTKRNQAIDIVRIIPMYV